MTVYPPVEEWEAALQARYQDEGGCLGWWCDRHEGCQAVGTHTFTSEQVMAYLLSEVPPRWGCQVCTEAAVTALRGIRGDLLGKYIERREDTEIGVM